MARQTLATLLRWRGSGQGLAGETPPNLRPDRRRFWVLAGLGVVVVLAGFLLPPLLLPGPADGSAREAAKEQRLPAHSLAAPAVPGEADASALFTRLAVSTVLVVGLMLGTLLALRRWLVRPLQAGPSDELRVLAATRIDRASQVFLVQARGQRLLVGADWTGVKLLVPVPPAVPAEEEGPP